MTNFSTRLFFKNVFSEVIPNLILQWFNSLLLFGETIFTSEARVFHVLPFLFVYTFSHTLPSVFLLLYKISSSYFHSLSLSLSLSFKSPICTQSSVWTNDACKTANSWIRKVSSFIPNIFYLKSRRKKEKKKISF